MTPDSEEVLYSHIWIQKINKLSIYWRTELLNDKNSCKVPSGSLIGVPFSGTFVMAKGGT